MSEQSLFSHRTNWNSLPNDLSLKRESLLQQGKSILDLTETNPTRCGLSFPTNEILSSLSHSENIFYSPNPQGILSARDAICAYYSERNISISPEQIILTSSSSEAYSFLFRLLCNVDDEILVPSPSYPLFDYLAEINDVHVKHYRLQYDGKWSIVLESIEQNITSRTKAIILVHPNNPTGSFISTDEREKIILLANIYHLAIIEDEVFSDFRFQILDFRLKNSNRISQISNLHFRLNGISKTLALPQMKLGWLIVEGNKKLKMEAFSRLEILADTFLSVNTPIQNALPKLFLQRKEIQQTIFERLLFNYNLLKNITINTPLTTLHCEGGWTAILRIPSIKTDDQFALELLEKVQVLVHPGHFFGFEKNGFIVISLLHPIEKFSLGIQKIIDFLKRISHS